MKPTIPLITMACCAFVTACSTVPDRARVGDVPADPDLATFYLPRVHFQNATLEEALTKISEDCEDISRRCGEKPRTLRFIWNGTPERRVNADFQKVPALTAIRRLALQAGMKASAQGNKVTLIGFADDRTRAERAFPVPPTFLTAIGATQNSLEPVLHRTGALAATDATARYDPHQSYLTVRSKSSDLQRSAELVDIVCSESPVLIKLYTKRVAFEHSHSFPTGIHSPAQTERWLNRAMAASGPSTLDTLPSVTARPGQSGTVETIHEYSLPSHQKKWLGTRVELKPELYGHAQVVRLAYERNLLLNRGQEIPPYVATDDRLRSHPMLSQLLVETRAKRKAPLVRSRTAAVNAIVPDGYYLIEETKGTSRMTEYVLFRATRLNSAGQPVRWRE